MIFVLHYIAAIQILFTLVANYVQSNPLILCESNNFDHDYAITAACTEAWASSSEAPLAFAQKRDQDPFSRATGTVGGQAPTSPFQRPGIHQPHQSRTNGEQCWTMEMQDLHENMQLNTSVLWRMWDFLAPMLRSIFSTSSSTDQVAALSSMELCQRLGGAGLGRSILGCVSSQRLAMDETSKAKNVFQTKVLTKSQQKGCRLPQRCKGKRQSSDVRAGKGRATCIDSKCNGPALAAIHELYCSHHATTCTAEHRGQATEDTHGGAEKTQRYTATRATKHGQRSCDQGRPTGNQTTPCSRGCPWTSTKGTTAGTACKVPPTQCMERIPQSSGHPVARLQCTIHGAGEADERTGQLSHGSTGSSQGMLGKSQIHCRHRSKGRCNDSQRRGTRQRPCGLDSRSHQGGPLQPANQLGGLANLSRTDGGGRAEGTQKASPRPSTCRSSKTIRIAWLCYGVWLGRVNTVMESIAQRPFSHAVSVSGCIPKWTHRVLQEPSFVSEWQANDAAFHLAWEVGILPPQISSGSTICPATNIAKAIMPHPVLRREGTKVDSDSQCPKGYRPGVKTVAFSEVLCIRIGEDTSNAFQDFVTHADAMLSPWKPWKLLPSTDADQQNFADVHFEHDSPMCHPLQSKHPSTRFVQVNSMPLRASVQTEVLYAAPQEAEHFLTSFTVQPETNFDVSPWNPQVAQLGCSNSQCSELFTGTPNPEADAHVHAEKVTPCPVEHTSPSTGRLPTGKADASRAVSPACSRSESCSVVSLVKHHRVFLSGLSQIDALLQDVAQQPSFLHRAVTSSNQLALDQISPADHHGSLSLIHEKTHIAEIDKHINSGSCLPPLMQVRREHESPIAHLVGPQSDDEDTDDEPMDTHNQPILPAFVNYLTNRLEALGLDPHDNDFDLPIRTWYIDHSTVHRWTAPRILQLVGPPRGWEAQIQSLWADQLNNQDWFDGIIVEPDPPRIARHAFVVFDMIVTQSLEVPRFASMITVMPGTADTFQMYSVACSLPEVVSGYELVQAADAGRYCRHAECLITYRWIQIPNTLRPTHHVGHGDGFQIVVHDQPHGSQTHRAEDASSSDAITTSPTYSPGRSGQAQYPACQIHHFPTPVSVRGS